MNIIQNYHDEKTGSHHIYKRHILLEVFALTGIASHIYAGVINHQYKVIVAIVELITLFIIFFLTDTHYLTKYMSMYTYILLPILYISGISLMIHYMCLKIT